MKKVCSVSRRDGDHRAEIIAQRSNERMIELQELCERFEVWRRTRKPADGIADGEWKMWRHHSRRAVFGREPKQPYRLRLSELSVNGWR